MGKKCPSPPRTQPKIRNLKGNESLRQQMIHGVVQPAWLNITADGLFAICVRDRSAMGSGRNRNR